MTTSITLRFAAAAASVCTTFVVFSMVASLAQPQQATAPVQVAQAKPAAVR
jgi:hypothetical protein